MHNQPAKAPAPLQEQLHQARTHRGRREWRRDLPFILAAGIVAHRAETWVRSEWGLSAGLGFLVFGVVAGVVYLGVRQLAQRAVPGYFRDRRAPQTT